MDNTIRVRVETIDGSAVETEDYIAVNEILTFEPGEKEKEVRNKPKFALSALSVRVHILWLKGQK